MNLSKIKLAFLGLGIVLLLTMFSSTGSMAQGVSNEVEMADLMRSNGKIYVVVAVILSIFAGLATYMVILDRKIAKMEKGEEK